MTEQEKLPRLLKWAKDGYPPIDLSNEFKAVIELIKYAQQRDELIKAADEVIRLNQIQGEGPNYVKALESYTALKQQSTSQPEGNTVNQQKH